MISIESIEIPPLLLTFSVFRRLIESANSLTLGYPSEQSQGFPSMNIP